MRLHHAVVPLCLIALVPGAAAVPSETLGAAAAGPPAAVRGGAGFVIAGAGLPEGLRSETPETPCYVLLVAARADLEEPARMTPVIAAARARGLRIVVRITDEDWQPIEAWFERVRAFAAVVTGDADAWQILGAEGSTLEPRAYAYLMKNARVALRAGGAAGEIVSLPLPRDPAWSEALFADDAAPYIDIVAAPDVASLPAVTATRDRLHPRAPIWVTGSPLDASLPAAGVVRDYLEATAAGGEVILFSAPAEPAPAEPAPAQAEPEESPPVESSPAEPVPAEPVPAEPAPAEPARPAGDVGAVEALVFARSQFPPGLKPSTSGSLPFDPAAAVEGGDGPGSAPVTLGVLAFFDPVTRDGIAAYRLGAAPGAVRLTLRSPLEAVDLLTPSSARTRRLAESAPPGAVLELPVRDEYLLLRYRVSATAVPVQEATRVGAVSELTAEEIIARERETRAIQQARLDHYEAKATIAIHYRIAAVGETIDLVTENRLYVKEGRQDYEQTALYVNGSLWRGKQPPYLPYLQPETVTEVPLDIRLDERYRYNLEGRETVDGRECYVLAFEPAQETTESLYRGRVYVDTRLFTRVRMSAVQTVLNEPLRSNEVVYRYGPVETSRGEAWLPQTMTGQLTFDLLGYALAVEREATYTDYRTNEAGFEDRRQTAYDSGRPLFRETEQGFFGLEKEGDQEALRRLDAPRNTLLVMGMSVGEDGDLGFPFAGVNFFDFDFRGTGTQFNLAWAGPYADISWNQPKLFDPGAGRRPWSLAVQGSFNALETEDKNATSAGTPSIDRVDILREQARTTLSIPFGNFVRLALEARFTYQNFDRQNKTSPEFVLPSTGLEGVGGGRLEFSRLGYLFGIWGEWGRRSTWDPWGVPGQRWSEDDIDFTRLGADLRKSFYFGIYNKLSLGVSGFEGRSLDRFSRFELGDFRSARVRGFNDSGIHFDRGLVAEASWSFPLGRSLRADLGVQDGFVHSGDDFGDGYERVIGSGLGLQFSGPWSTFVNVRLSRALSTTIPDKGSGGDLRVVFFKTFDKWSRKGGSHRPPAVPVVPATPEGDAPR